MSGYADKTITLTAPTGMPRVLGKDGIFYPVIAGQVTMPVDAAPDNWASVGFANITKLA